MIEEIKKLLKERKHVPTAITHEKEFYYSEKDVIEMLNKMKEITLDWVIRYGQAEYKMDGTTMRSKPAKIDKSSILNGNTHKNLKIEL